MKGDLPARWDKIRKDRSALTARQRKILGRRNWFVRMAERGFVPAPEAKANKAALIVAVFPDLFPSVQIVGPYIKRERWDLLEPNGFTTKVAMKVILPGKRYPVPVLVNAKTPAAATVLLESALPKGTEIEKTRASPVLPEKKFTSNFRTSRNQKST